MNRSIVSATAVAAGFLLWGCATPTVVQTVKVTDSDLSCDGLKNEITDAERFEADARKERGMTKTNVVAAVFFFPALGATYLNTEDAINAAKERKEHLLDLARKKRCGFAVGGAVPQSQPATRTTPTDTGASSRSATIPQADSPSGAVGVTLLEAQKRLAELGYDPGPPDGKMGVRTANAIRQYQRDRGIPVTGVLDPPTQSALR